MKEKISSRKKGSTSPSYWRKYRLSIKRGDLVLLDGRWYVTHSGLLRIARESRCAGIHVEPVADFSNPTDSRWAFKATVYRSRTCKGFIGFGDANPANVSSLVHGAEMRVAETRAVNRALRKAYGIGICSVEEIGTVAAANDAGTAQERLRPQPINRSSFPSATRVRDRLCQVIRQHQLDPILVKSYAVDYCGVKALRDASREQIENFVTHLSHWAEEDRNALLCRLNSYPHSQEGVA